MSPIRGEGTLRLLGALGVMLALSCGSVRDVARQAENAAVAAAEYATTPAMACDAEVPQDPPVGCLSGTLRCGDTIEGTTVGGESRWDDSFYAGKFCFPAFWGHGGPERAYLFQAPAHTGVTIRLQSDCADLDLIAVSYGYSGTCPDLDHAVGACEGDDKSGGGRVYIESLQRGATWVIGVDGKGGEVGPFRLKVDCQDLGR